MSNKDIYKSLGIKPGDSLNNQQITRISHLRKQRDGVLMGDGATDGGAPAPVQSNRDPWVPDPTDAAIIQAIEHLDPGNDAHWTLRGKPAMKAIEMALATDRVQRADVERLCPDVVRSEIKP